MGGINKVISMFGFGAKEAEQAPEQPVQPSKQAIIASIPTSPSPENKINLFDAEDVLASQKDVVDKISLTLGFDHNLAKDLVEDVVLNFIRYVHLLPASESHHHSEPGGLLRHSLEVALYSVNLTTSYTFAVKEKQEYRVGARDAYPYASFLAALFHDLGKAFYDIRVLTPDGAKECNPFCENIYEFMEAHEETGYIYRFNKKRVHKFHEMISLTFFSKLLSKRALGHLTSRGITKDVFFNLVLAMSDKEIDERDHGIDAKIIRDILIKSDKNSVKRYMAGAISLFGSDGKPLSRDDLMKRLIIHSVDIGEAELNRLSSQLFYLDNNYLMAVINKDFVANINLVAKEIEATMPDSIEAMNDFFKKSMLAVKHNGEVEHTIKVEINDKKLTLKGVLLHIDDFEPIIDDLKPIEILKDSPAIPEKKPVDEESEAESETDDKQDNAPEEKDDESNEEPGGYSDDEIDAMMAEMEEDASNDEPELEDEPNEVDEPKQKDDGFKHDTFEKTELPSGKKLDSSLFEIGAPSKETEREKPRKAKKTKPKPKAETSDKDVKDDKMSDFIISHLVEHGTEGVDAIDFMELIKKEFQLSQHEAFDAIDLYADKQGVDYVLKERFKN